MAISRQALATVENQNQDMTNGRLQFNEVRPFSCSWESIVNPLVDTQLLLLLLPSFLESPANHEIVNLPDRKTCGNT